MTGRPSIYSQELADEICARIAGGESLRRICRDDDMPSMQSVFKWRREKPEFAEQYARAKDDCADALAEEIQEIADDGTNDWMIARRKDGSEYEALNKEAIMRSRLRVDTRKWIAAKLKPKRYGDVTRHEHTGADGGPIEITDNQLASKLVAILDAAHRRMIDGECEDLTGQALIEHDEDDGSDLL